MSYIELVRRLPVPAPQQLGNFAKDFCWMGSWYRALSLRYGNLFTFVLNPDAAKDLQWEKVPQVSPALRRYDEMEKQTDVVYEEMRAREMAKVLEAVQKLAAWHTSVQQG